MDQLIRNIIENIYKLKQKCYKKIDRILFIWLMIWIKKRRLTVKSNVII